MFLGLDLGTGSAKALLLDVDGSIVGTGASTYAVHNPQPGWAESNPEDWWDAATIAVREAVGNRGVEVAAIGLSGQMHGVVLCQDDGRPLRPAILWADARARKELDAYHALSPGLKRSLANPIATGMAGPTLLWVRDHEEDVRQVGRDAVVGVIVQTNDRLVGHLFARLIDRPLRVDVGDVLTGVELDG